MALQQSTRQRVIGSAVVAVMASVAGSTAWATTYTWDGGGTDNAWSTDANWAGDPTTGPVNGDSLIFAGTTQLTPDNDYLTSLGSTAFTFASGAGSFNVASSFGRLTVGSGGNDNLVTQNSANDQQISADLKLAGGQKDRTIVFGGTGKLTFSGNVDFSNDWLFPNTSAGTIVLSGNNSGDGKGGVLNAGTNTSRAMLRNNVANTTLVLGSDTALGNSGSGDIAAGTANFRGLVANQNLVLQTANGNRDLSGSTVIINAPNVTFGGTDNLSLGNVIVQGGNRDFAVSSTGQVTIQDSISMSNDQTGRNLYVNLSGTGGMVVNGKLYDTFHSGGLTSGQSTFRKAGTGTITLNGDSNGYNGLITIEAGTLKLGHANALGKTGATAGTSLTGNATLDLNGITTGETITVTNAGNALVNSSSTAAGLTADATLNDNLTINTTGDITATRLIGTNTRTVTKLGDGTLTTNGSNHNNLVHWNIQAGKVVLGNTAGYGADRGVEINGGTLQLSGSNSDLINNAEVVAIASGTLDLNGKSEALSLAGTGGTVTNGLAASTSTLTIGGGSGGSYTGTFAGVLSDGAGLLALVKEGTGTQTLTGANSYTGDTSIAGGTLSISNPYLADSSSVLLTSGATFDLTYAGSDLIAALYFDGVSQAAGTWGAVGSGAQHESAFLTGGGTLTVVPEPASLGLVAIGGLALLRRRRA